MEVISICLSDIPKDKIKKANNGKCYTNIVINPMRNTDEYGNDLTVYMKQSKDERLERSPKVYIGKGQTINFNEGSPVSHEKVDSMASASDDDLPF